MYLCVDMKSFFASVECSLRNLNPLTTPLVVVDDKKGKGAIVLAVSPYLKKLGIPGRCRLFEIPKEIAYIKAKPRMRKYIEFASKIHNIFLRYVSQDDIHTYSIDEAFIYVENYLGYESAKVLALTILQDIKKELGISATCGCGDNLFLAKVALDIYAKNSTNFFDYLSYDKFIKVTWYHQKLTDIWQIGRGIAKRLNKLGMYNLADVAHGNLNVLEKEFGVIGKDIYEHSWGRDDTRISDIKAYNPLNKSFSRNQILFRDYSKEEAWTPICEMLYLMCVDLSKNNLACLRIHIGIGLSDNSCKLSKSVTLTKASNDYFYLKRELGRIYDTFIVNNLIRIIYISFSGLIPVDNIVHSLFDFNDERYDRLSKQILSIWDKYGKNKAVIGTALTEESTLYERNKCIGGHNSE